jgi:hypothetical protein
VQIASALIQALLGLLPNPFPRTGHAVTVEAFAVVALLFLVQGVPVLLGQLLSLSAVAALVEDAVEGRELSWQRSLRQGLGRLPGVLATQIRFGVLFFICSLFFVIPGFIFFGYCCFAVYIAALRKTWGGGGLDYSYRLVTGQGLMVFIVMFVLEAIKSGFRQSASSAFGLFDGMPACSVLGSLGVEFALSLVTVIIVLYFLNNDYTRGPSKKEPANTLPGAPELPRFQLTDSTQ